MCRSPFRVQTLRTIRWPNVLRVSGAADSDRCLPTLVSHCQSSRPLTGWSCPSEFPAQGCASCALAQHRSLSVPSVWGGSLDHTATTVNLNGERYPTWRYSKEPYPKPSGSWGAGGLICQPLHELLSRNILPSIAAPDLVEAAVVAFQEILDIRDAHPGTDCLLHARGTPAGFNQFPDKEKDESSDDRAQYDTALLPGGSRDPIVVVFCHCQHPGDVRVHLPARRRRSSATHCWLLFLTLRSVDGSPSIRNLASVGQRCPRSSLPSPASCANDSDFPEGLVC